MRVGGEKLIQVEDYLKGTQLSEWYPRSPTEVHSQELRIIHKVGFFDFITAFSRCDLFVHFISSFYFTTVMQDVFMKKI